MFIKLYLILYFSWDRVDPFSSLRTAMSDSTSMLMCLCVFLSYLPEAGQYSCFFIYLTQAIGFSEEQVTTFIAVVGEFLNSSVDTKVPRYFINFGANCHYVYNDTEDVEIDYDFGGTFISSWSALYLRLWSLSYHHVDCWRFGRRRFNLISSHLNPCLDSCRR